MRSTTSRSSCSGVDEAGRASSAKASWNGLQVGVGQLHRRGNRIGAPAPAASEVGGRPSHLHGHGLIGQPERLEHVSALGEHSHAGPHPEHGGVEALNDVLRGGPWTDRQCFACRALILDPGGVLLHELRQAINEDRQGHVRIGQMAQPQRGPAVTAGLTLGPPGPA